MPDNRNPFNNNDNDFMNNQQKNTPPEQKQPRGILIFIIFSLIILSIFTFMGNDTNKEIDYSDFKQRIETGEIRQVKITQSYLLGYTKSHEELEKEHAGQMTMLNNLITQQSDFTVYKTTAINDAQLIPLLDSKQVEYRGELPKNNDLLMNIIFFVGTIAVLIFISRSLMKRMGGAGAMGFIQNKNRIVAETDLKTKFTDVAGCDESKEELAEIVDFLKNPAQYTDIGGRIPKGALLVGPPGTGKTLLARAVAGEAGVTFFRMSGADFVELFVGVGAARVRDLFMQARQKAPCIIFIDEIDAIGKSRANNMSTNDEREQTLNQLLVEMDGFDNTTGVIILAATNRPEVLDAALLRAGRFDRQIMVDRPDIKGREAILKIHAKNVKLHGSVDLHSVAVGTPGLVGSDLANIVNEAALLAVRGKRKEVTQADFEEAIEKAAMGIAKRTRVMSRFERENTAYHEVGHALINVFTPNANPLRKVTIVPRGFALGVTWSSPIEGRYSKTEDELIAHIDMTLGGRAAEQIIYGHITTGASNDIQQATDVAKSMIMEYGMSERFKNVAFTRRQSVFLEGSSSREFSESTQQYIDDEISRLISKRYDHVLTLLKKHINLLRSITKVILEKESLSAEEFIGLVKADPSGEDELKTVAERSLTEEQLTLTNQ